MTEGVFDDMEFLVRELHKEWERSGKVKIRIIIEKEDISLLQDKIAEMISSAVDAAEADMSFRQYIGKSKECYVLFRMAKKIMDLGAGMDRGKAVKKYSLELDEEEFMLLMKKFEKEK